jgi:hypothetical protein
VRSRNGRESEPAPVGRKRGGHSRQSSLSPAVRRDEPSEFVPAREGDPGFGRRDEHVAVVGPVACQGSDSTTVGADPIHVVVAVAVARDDDVCVWLRAVCSAAGTPGQADEERRESDSDDPAHPVT